MRRVLIRANAAFLAVIVVAVAVWAFFIPAHVFVLYTTILECMCVPQHWYPASSDKLLAANGWFKINVRQFNLYAPPGTMIRPTNKWDGRIVTPRFVLNYEIGSTGFAAADRDVVDEPVRIDGRSAVLRRAITSDGSYFGGLFVQQALVLNRHSVSLLIQGSFRTRGDRAVADAVLQTVSFEPFLPPVWEHQPPAVRAEPPTFDIAPDPA